VTISGWAALAAASLSVDSQTLFPDVGVTVENGFVASGNCVVAALPDETMPKLSILPRSGTWIEIIAVRPIANIHAAGFGSLLAALARRASSTAQPQEKSGRRSEPFSVSVEHTAIRRIAVSKTIAVARAVKGIEQKYR
jgi:hypothetical protein